VAGVVGTTAGEVVEERTAEVRAAQGMTVPETAAKASAVAVAAGAAPVAPCEGRGRAPLCGEGETPIRVRKKIHTVKWDAYVMWHTVLLNIYYTVVRLNAVIVYIVW
jgi:hypothetical protein